MRSDSDRLDDILHAIDNAEKYRSAGEERFLDDELLQIWALHHLLIIGEAARGVSASLREENTNIPWQRIIALRNVVVHEYFGLNLRQVWMVLVRDLPALRAEIARIRESLAP
jgi:uncharacterized protein with HEPN domain